MVSGQQPSGPQPRPARPGRPVGTQPGERPTEYIPKVEETDYIPRLDDWDDVPDAADADRDVPAGTATARSEQPPPRNPGRRPPQPADDGWGRKVVRGAGELMITCGVVIMLFVVYEVYITDLFSAHKQQQATTALQQEWDTVGGQRTTHYDLTDGHGIAVMYIPALGPDYRFTIVEGDSQADLAIGPGHYPGSALPGEPGDFAVAGHRVGQGAPFNDLDLVSSCDSIVVETAGDWFVYRVLPFADEVSGWANSAKAKSPLCNGPDGEGGKVAPLGGEYSQTVGQETVLPSESDVVAPVPHFPYTTVSEGQEVSLMTMTTCTPKFSSSHRLIVHAVLVQDWKKNPSSPNYTPPELKETS
jgi:sortase A